MKRFSVGFGALSFALILLGCGGSAGRTDQAQVSGIVTDLDSNPVRGAKVSFNFSSASRGETLSNSNGIYVLDMIPEGNIVIRAEVTQDGITYRGQNVARTFAHERSKSVNITVAPVDRLARAYGTVRTREGYLVENAEVFFNGGTLSSNRAVTDENGEFEIRDLIGGIAYDVLASARTYDSDLASLTLSPGENRRIDFVLEFESNPGFLPPNDLTAVAWTSPAEEILRSPGQAEAYEQLKRLFDPRRASRKAQGRDTIAGNPIEVDLYWSPAFDEALLGYGIYRGAGVNAPTSSLDYLRDPMTGTYADLDRNLFEGNVYTYQITALNTSYPDFSGSESSKSTPVWVETLGDLILMEPRLSPLSFRWQNFSGAEEYIVYLFDREPKIGVSSFWNNEGAPTDQTFLNYTGPSLVSGRTYYYLVLGLANSQSSRTISRLASFVAP